jgi:D-tyrosyl-tRNA(Tyr) deacylase
MKKRAVFIFCGNLEKDPVAAGVLKQSQALFPLAETSQFVDGHHVLTWERPDGAIFYFVTTAEIISDDYAHYLPIMKGLFADCSVAGLVNWHAGGNAPDKVLCVHTTGDVPSGQFGPASPAAMFSLLRALEEFRQGLRLHDFRTSIEATHWSGVQNGQDPRLLLDYTVPLMDIEIGSCPTSYGDVRAAEAVARALPRVFDDLGPFKSLLCVGGMHFEPAFNDPVLNTTDPLLGASHVLPNQWLETYTDEGTQGRLLHCVNTIAGGIDAIVFHDNLKGAVKAQLRTLAETLGVPAIKHQRLRMPGTIEWPTHDHRRQTSLKWGSHEKPATGHPSASPDVNNSSEFNGASQCLRLENDNLAP